MFATFSGGAFETIYPLQTVSGSIEILIIAENEEAVARYAECIGRHPEIEEEEPPQIAEFWGDWDLINEAFNEDNRTELDVHFSAPVYI